MNKIGILNVFEHSPEPQQGVPRPIEESLALSWPTASSAVNILFISSLLEGDGDDGEGDVGEERLEVAVVEAAEEEDDELPSGRHSSQQQQQQSMNAWPSERHRKRSNTGDAEQRRNSRNCPIRPSAGRVRAGSAAITWSERYARVMLQMLSGRLHETYKMVSAMTVERNRCSLPCCFFLAEEEAEEEGEEHLLVPFPPLGFCACRWASTCLVTRSQARVKRRGKQM